MHLATRQQVARLVQGNVEFVDGLCESADRAMQVHGGLGYSRHKPFEHIYRHHRRYRITEGAEEIQMRRVAGYMFGFMKQRAPKGVAES